MNERLHPVGEALSEAIRQAAYFAVQERRGKDEFVTLVTKAAIEAFDSQVNNAVVRAKQLADEAP